jgi:hypothetical protein
LEHSVGKLKDRRMIASWR